MTKPRVNPAWVRKAPEVVRNSQLLRGTGDPFEGLRGFGRPIDTAFNPDVPSIIYVSDHALNCIWQVTVLNTTGRYGEPLTQVSNAVPSDLPVAA